MSRQTIFSDELATTICRRLVEGESLRSICRDPEMPGLSTVFDWLEANEAFRSKYARARDLQMDVYADETVEIADDGRNDWMEKLDAEGNAVGWAQNGEAMKRSQLRIGTRQWMAEKLKPKKYGNRIAQEHSGANGEALVFNISTTPPKKPE